MSEICEICEKENPTVKVLVKSSDPKVFLNACFECSVTEDVRVLSPEEIASIDILGKYIPTLDEEVKESILTLLGGDVEDWLTEKLEEEEEI